MSDQPTKRIPKAQFMNLELFRGKPLSEHLAYVQQQIAEILNLDSGLEFDEQMRVELETLEVALTAYINRAKKQEIVQKANPPLVSWKSLMKWRYLPGDKRKLWSHI